MDVPGKWKCFVTGGSAIILQYSCTWGIKIARCKHKPTLCSLPRHLKTARSTHCQGCTKHPLTIKNWRQNNQWIFISQPLSGTLWTNEIKFWPVFIPCCLSCFAAGSILNIYFFNTLYCYFTSQPITVFSYRFWMRSVRCSFFVGMSPSRW